MTLKPILKNKKRYLLLLLEGDEQEDMIDRYIEGGDMFALFDSGVSGTEPVGVCVVTECEGWRELKNIAVERSFRRRGYGRAMLELMLARYAGCGKMFVGTGETPAMMSFYGSVGFEYSHRIEGFFTDNYAEPIVEEGVTLRDMIYLSRDC